MVKIAPAGCRQSQAMSAFSAHVTQLLNSQAVATALGVARCVKTGGLSLLAAPHARRRQCKVCVRPKLTCHHLHAVARGC